jgi:hypothetical protein
MHLKVLIESAETAQHCIVDQLNRVRHYSSSCNAAAVLHQARTPSQPSSPSLSGFIVPMQNCTSVIGQHMQQKT